MSFARLNLIKTLLLHLYIWYTFDVFEDGGEYVILSLILILKQVQTLKILYSVVTPIHKTILEIILPSKNLDNIPLLIETWYVVKIRKPNANIKHHLYVRWFADSSSLSHWHADRSSLAKVTLQISF